MLWRAGGVDCGRVLRGRRDREAARRGGMRLFAEGGGIALTPSAAPIDQDLPDRRLIVTALGVTQVLAWGSTFYLLGVLANPMVRDTGWRYEWVMGGISVAFLVAGAVSPRVGRAIGQR